MIADDGNTGGTIKGTVEKLIKTSLNMIYKNELVNETVKT